MQSGFPTKNIYSASEKGTRMSILLTDGAIIVYEAVLSVGLFANSLRFYRKNKKLKEMVSLQKDRIREEELDAKLQNRIYIERNAKSDSKNNPYEVNYHEEENAAYENEKEYLSIQIEELGNLSNKKYVIHVFDQVRIGRDDSNKIILNDTTIAGHQLELLRVGKELFVKNLDESVSVTLRRKRGCFAIKGGEVCLKNGDELTLGNTTLRLYMI